MKLVEYMPQVLKNVREFREIFATEDTELEQLSSDINSILTEVIVKTAKSYGLRRYEDIYHIKSIAETLEARRMNILLRMNNRVPFTIKWLVKTLDEAIGRENYIITNMAHNYQLNIRIKLNFTEAAEILKKNLVQQIPANIELSYVLVSTINEFNGAVISQQTYMELDAVAIESKEDIKVNQNNNTGLNLSMQDYLEVYPNEDAKIENQSINLSNETGIKVSTQDYIIL